MHHITSLTEMYSSSKDMDMGLFILLRKEKKKKKKESKRQVLSSLSYQ